MRWADSVPCSHAAALQERECRFYGVRVNAAHDVNLAAAVDVRVTDPSLRRVGVLGYCATQTLAHSNST